MPPSPATLLAAILDRQPSWAELPPALPTSVRQLLKWCLEEDPRFIMVSEPEDALPSQSRRQVDIVLNWFEELRRVGSRD